MRNRVPDERTNHSVPQKLSERNSSFKCYTMDMDATSETTPARSTRQAQTAANDERIIAAARAFFLSDPNAPISAIAERAGVGIAALYRRYPSKEELIRQIYHENQRLIMAEVEAALAADGDPWEIFCRFYHRVLDVGGGSLSLRFPGAFTFTGEIERLGRELSNDIRAINSRMALSSARPRRSSSPVNSKAPGKRSESEPPPASRPRWK